MIENRASGVEVNLDELEIALDRHYQGTERWARFGNGQLTVDRKLPAWGRQQVEVRPVEPVRIQEKQGV